MAKSDRTFPEAKTRSCRRGWEAVRKAPGDNVGLRKCHVSLLMLRLCLSRTILFVRAVSSPCTSYRVPCLSPILLQARMSSTTIAAASATSAFTSIDLKGYDVEQARLMDERCIVVDENDRAIGALDKKTCLYLN